MPESAELKTKILKKQLSVRGKLWPDVKDDELWFHKGKDGFVPIPRVMPLVLRIMDQMSSRPVSSTYFDLWCRKWDEQFITINRSLNEYAFYAGFAKQRGVQTWKERVRELQRLGFIKVEPGPSGDISYILILNPIKVIEKNATDKTKNVPKDYLNALRARGSQVEAKDVLSDKPDGLPSTGTKK